VISTFQRGETVYQRTVRDQLPASSIEDNVPLLTRDELVCEPASSRALHCTSVEVKQPTIPRGVSELVTYSVMNLTFSPEGVPIIHVGEPTIALTYADE
jgi:hypothetical protein